jgi:DNA (cytosine-5)-methyltransferase 1
MADAALDQAHVWSDVATFDGRAWRGKVDIVTAGYPCQPFSGSGKRLGDKDSRHLWPHVRRILEETTAPLLFVENVQGHISLGLETVWNDLQAMGYAVEAGIFSAAEVGASHLRNRLFLLAHADSRSVRDMARSVSAQWASGAVGWSPPSGDTHGGESLDAAIYDGHGESAGLFPPSPAAFGTWASWLAAWSDLQPAVAGGHDGLAFKMDRYRLTGNGVCPLAAAYAFCSLLHHAVNA